MAKLKGATGIDDSKPYAELWMGTHPSGPARVASTNELLADWLRANPSAVGQVPAGYAGNDLPFLFKVLSIQTALSIQAHPDKVLAHDLHARYPDVYKDSNHKPEMAIALTPFEAMCGFRPVSEIKSNLVAYPELAEIIGAEACGRFQAVEGEGSGGSHSMSLKGLFRAFMDCDEDKAKQQIVALVARLSATPGASSSGSSADGGSDDTFVRSLIVRLNKDYPGDRGALCPLLLNCLRLAEGQVTTPHTPPTPLPRCDPSPQPCQPRFSRLHRARPFSWVQTSRTRTYPETASKPWLCRTTWYAQASRPRYDARACPDATPGSAAVLAETQADICPRRPPSTPPRTQSSATSRRCAPCSPTRTAARSCSRRGESTPTRCCTGRRRSLQSSRYLRPTLLRGSPILSHVPRFTHTLTHPCVQVEVCTLPSQAEPYSLAVLDCASLLLFFKGATCALAKGGDSGTSEAAPLGSVVFLAAGAAATVHAGADGAVFFRAHVNLG